ncbi:glycosyltransferase involved in cell wall biosynthesis [Nocardioides sp. BE266]|uniref:glycosyltransferase family 4 protein n=1 Tax=Nocardioides sp. BE266 TaxID=2817725 RepID=UPI002857C177|nr:glycosyltransferase family 4 protein [Nocardioides sp. BE266]MDR7252083.1 glycosyltransferase involved in cell wall biosynthesis [Nocardioides sp. BE266]
MPAERIGVELLVVDSSHRQQRTDETSTVHRVASGLRQLLIVLHGLLARFMTSGRPSCVHVNSSGSLGLVRDLIALTVCRGLRVRTVLHLRFGRTPEILSNGSGEGRLLRRAVRTASVTLSIDEPTHRAVSNLVGSTRAQILPNFIETERYEANLERDSRVALFVGSVGASKGIDELVSAWTDLAPSGWHLRLVGPPAATYASPAWLGTLDASIELVGPRSHDEVIAEMTQAAFLVLPSHTEGFPNVILEAMATGTPVVATSVGAIPAMLRDGAGIVVPPKDVPALVAALEVVTSAPEIRSSMAATALRRVRETYSLDVVVDAYRRLWLSE